MDNNPFPRLIAEKYKRKEYEGKPFCVYFITDGEYVKVGITKSLPSRLHQLQIANPKKLTVMFVANAETREDARTIESMIHEEFAIFHSHGEWFGVTEDEIKHICDKLGVEIGFPEHRKNRIPLTA